MKVVYGAMIMKVVYGEMIMKVFKYNKDYNNYYSVD